MRENQAYNPDEIEFGIHPYLLVTIEECAELLVTISHYFKGKIKKEKLAEDIADLQIALDNISSLVGRDLVNKKFYEQKENLNKRL